MAGSQLGWDGLKFDDVFEHFGYDIDPQPRYFKPKEPAILTVPSRLQPGNFHAVFYKDGVIFDPTTRAQPYCLRSALVSAVNFYQWKLDNSLQP